MHASLRSKSDQDQNKARAPERRGADAPAGPLQSLLNSSPRVTQLRAQSDLLNRDANARQFAGSGKGVVQAYSIQRDPVSKGLYSLSDDQSVVTGMKTPNHQLYVHDASKIAAINAAAKQSMLKFSAGGKGKLFARDYTRVMAGFKEVSYTKKGMFGSSKRDVDIDKEYHGKVAPAAAKQNMAKYEQAVNEIMKTGWNKSYPEIKGVLKDGVQAVELFKKLVIANQATEDFHELVNQMQAPTEMVKAMESLIYSKAATPQLAKQTHSELARQLGAITSDFAHDEHLQVAAGALVQCAAYLAELLPKDVPVNLILVHSVNYREAMLESIKMKDPLFYRACDVMASTVLGNKLTPENEDQLKIYSAGGNTQAFHYAAKILSAGPDWVSLESFAAGARESEILGLDDESALTNIDNSWQYMMYGSVKKRGQTGGEQDNAFELYTKLRYQLKGIDTKEGKFRTDQRDRLHSLIPRDAFITIGGINEQASDRIWTRLQMNGVFDETGKVKNPSYLAESYVSLRLDERDRDKAAAISLRLKALYGAARAASPRIQGSASNEFRNIVAWLKLQKPKFDVAPLEQALQHSLAEGHDPLSLHNRSWKALLVATEK